MGKFKGLILGCVFLAGCSISKPCSEAGDTSWEPVPPRLGDQSCRQVRGTDGRFVNEGKYVQKYSNGKPAIMGAFKNGKRDGVWVLYDETGQRKVERMYRDGVETYLPAPPSQ